METLSSKNFERKPDIYRMIPEQNQHNFAGDKEALSVAVPPEATDIFEALDNEPDYVDKLTMTPLPLEKMSELLQRVASQYTEDDGSHQALFNKVFVGSMQTILQRLMESARPGDNITFDDLSWAAEAATEHTNKINIDSILNDPSFVEETNSITGITEKFASLFDQRPDLAYIGDDIDSYTVHPDVHTDQKDRIKDNPEENTFGQEHGQNGRWIPERRGGMTVWVTKEQKQQEEKVAHKTEARTAVEDAYTAKVSESQKETVVSEPGNPEQGGTASQAEMLAKIPDDERERIQFANQNFAEINVDKIPLLTAFIQKEVSSIAARVPEGSRYPDTIAAVLGNGGKAWNFLRAVVSAKRGGRNIIEPNDFNRLSFSEVAKSIGIDVKKLIPDYEQRFHTREMVW